MMSYSTLAADVARWVDRTDMDDDIEDCISLAESEISRKLRIPLTQSTLTFDNTATAGTFSTVPYDCKQVRRITWCGKPLEHVSDIQIAERLNSDYDSLVNAFAIVDGQFIFSVALESDPADWGDDTLVITYYSTNCVFDSDPDLYLKGSMYYTHLFLREAPKALEWKALFIEALNEVKSSGKASRYSGSSKQVTAAYGDSV